MALDAGRLEELYQAREENRLRPVEELIAGIEEQIDNDLKSGWGDVHEEFPDPRDPRKVMISITVELDAELMDPLDELAEAQRMVVERELQRRYLTAGFHSLALLDGGRVRIQHLIEHGSEAAPPAVEPAAAPTAETPDTGGDGPAGTSGA